MCHDMTSALGQEYSIQTMDQQLYAVAQQVKWAAGDEFADHSLRLGGFHTLATFIASIGKIWGDGGLRDLLADSGVYAPNTVDQMLSGKQFNRAVRGLTLAYEAFSQLWMESFLEWCTHENLLDKIPNHVWKLLCDVQSSFREKDASIADMLTELSCLVETHLVPLMTKYRKE